MIKTADQDWLTIKVLTSSGKADEVCTLLEELGAMAVTYEDAADSPILEPLPGERRLWPQTVVTGLWEQGRDGTSLLLALRTRLGDNIPISEVKVQDQNWVRAWMDQFKPIACGNRLWICPSWLEVKDPQAVVVMLDPGLAFGSGSHPTTWLCLNALDSMDLTGLRVLDFGCGSGILGIAALKLGAQSCTGVDIDPQALQASRSNAERNHIERSKLKLRSDSTSLNEVFALTVANILLGPLTDLEGEIARLTDRGGTLLLSGLLKEQSHTVRQAYEKDFEFVEQKESEDWVLLRALRR